MSRAKKLTESINEGNSFVKAEAESIFVSVEKALKTVNDAIQNIDDESERHRVRGNTNDMKDLNQASKDLKKQVREPLAKAFQASRKLK